MYQFSKMLYRLIDFSCSWFVQRRIRCGEQEKKKSAHKRFMVKCKWFFGFKTYNRNDKMREKKISNKNRTNRMKFTVQDFNRLIEKDFAPNEIRLPFAFFFLLRKVYRKRFACYKFLSFIVFHVETCECAFVGWFLCVSHCTITFEWTKEMINSI